MKTKLFFVTLVLAALAASVRAADALEMDLWQNGAPSSNGDAGDKARCGSICPKPQWPRAGPWLYARVVLTASWQWTMRGINGPSISMPKALLPSC